ncbi:MAG: hypothetical protein U9M90_03945 [Patescibacteria group bacterium]|nr:hypothetical protein [Patescibacteria group bacterium]
MQFFIACALLLLPFSFANAYLDPGSGSFIIQLIIGAMLGSLIAVKTYFKKIKSSFLKLFGKQSTDKDKDDEE